MNDKQKIYTCPLMIKSLQKRSFGHRLGSGWTHPNFQCLKAKQLKLKSVMLGKKYLRCKTDYRVKMILQQEKEKTSILWKHTAFIHQNTSHQPNGNLFFIPNFTCNKQTKHNIIHIDAKQWKDKASQYTNQTIE